MPTLPLHDPTGAPRPLPDLLHDLHAHAAQGHTRLLLLPLTDTLPDTLPDLLSAALTADLHTNLRATPALHDREHIRALITAGLRALHVDLSDLHSPLTATLHAAARLDHLHLQLHATAHLLTLPEQVVQLAADTGASLWWHGDPDAPAQPTTDRVEQVWLACQRLGVPLRTTGFGLAPTVSSVPTEPHLLDLNLIELLRESVPLRAPRAGLRLTHDRLGRRDPVPASLTEVLRLTHTAQDTAGLLGAVGWPVHELPACHGGLGQGPTGPSCARCPGPPTCHGQLRALPPPEPGAASVGLRDLHPQPRVHLLLPHLADGLFVHGTLPGLAHALEQQGAQVTVHSAWHNPFNPEAPALDPHDPPPADAEARQRYAKDHLARFARQLDLTDADAVIAPGWQWAGAVLRHPTLPPHARVVLADLHLMQGIEAWKARYLPPGRRSMEGGWWPDPRVQVHSCFPSFAHLYWYAGVPMSQLHWLPYPTSRLAFPPGPPPERCATIFTGGAHLRAHDVLLRAAELLPATTHPLHLHAPGRATGRWPAALHHQGTSPLPDFYEAIRRSRFVVVPLQHHVSKAAGISVIALARAAGRAVITTATSSTRAYVHHEVDGLLVPADDPEALAAAIARLDHDEDLLTRLSTAATAAGQQQDVATWAHHLLDGAPLIRTVRATDGSYGPW